MNEYYKLVSLWNYVIEMYILKIITYKGFVNLDLGDSFWKHCSDLENSFTDTLILYLYNLWYS